jgi:hypothetical protein
MANNQIYTSRRAAITKALADKIKEINGRGVYYQNIAEVSPYLKFWDEVVSFPAVHLNAGAETRDYQTGGYKDRFLNVILRLYVNQDSSTEALDELLQDVETVIEDNSVLQYKDRDGVDQCTQQITVVSIDTDEGVLDPLGVAEMLIEVRY